MAFYIPFRLLLKRTTFFAVNRIYLVLGLLLSPVFPLYTGIATIPSSVAPDLPFMEPLVTQTESVISQVNEPTGLLSIAAFLVSVYVAGIVVRVIRLAFSISGILKLQYEGKVSVYQGVKVVRTNTSVPFSFFNQVILPTDLDNRGVLAHEAAHVRQYHWIDLLIVELVSIILWFNPLMMAYKRSLKQQHEYLADRSAIKTGINMGEYLISIRQQMESAIPFPLISEFYFQSIKNRINMLTKRRTSVYGLVAYTFTLPLIICLLMAFSVRRDFKTTVYGEVDSTSGLSLGLPIDKKYNFVLEAGYGERMHPVLKVMRMHTGIDLVVGEGVPVVSAEDGLVVEAELANAWGNKIIVRHDDTYSTSYSHLKSMGVKEGDKVSKGQVIGLVGHTGMSGKDHLHFEVLKNGKAVDPMGYLPEMR